MNYSCAFERMLKEYCMVDDMDRAEEFASKLACSSIRRDQLLRECSTVLGGEIDPALFLEAYYEDYDKGQDYIDSLRRAPYVGMGI